MSYEIQKIWDRHHQMKRLAILGLSYRQIANACGVTEVTVRNVLSSPLMKQQLELMQAAADSETIDVNMKIKKMAEKAVTYLDEILSNDDAPVSLRAKIAMDTLDRAGFPKHTAISGQVFHAHLTKEDIDRIKTETVDIIEGEFKLIEDNSVSSPNKG